MYSVLYIYIYNHRATRTEHEQPHRAPHARRALACQRGGGHVDVGTCPRPCALRQGAAGRLHFRPPTHPRRMSCRSFRRPLPRRCASRCVRAEHSQHAAPVQHRPRRARWQSISARTGAARRSSCPARCCARWRCVYTKTLVSPRTSRVPSTLLSH